MEITFCRRCAAPLTKLSETNYICSKGHKLFYDAAPAAASILVTHDGKVVLTVRAIDPRKGKNSLFGGFVDYNESCEEALARELEEEVGLTPEDYEKPVYLTSAPDTYDWEGNTTRVLSMMYLVRLKPGVQLKPADDVADVVYVTPDTIPYDNIGFPSNVIGIKAALDALREAT
jgi:NAD+ diphosphatase